MKRLLLFIIQLDLSSSVSHWVFAKYLFRGVSWCTGVAGSLKDKFPTKLVNLRLQ